ncbi:MAG: hypothetical protein IJU82_06175 [Ruminiclostridium sp.]|nr:hypothetical protein [Ruminiclostridium sp.]
MYKCNRCGGTGEKPARLYEEGEITAQICRTCGSDDIRISSVCCSVCGEPLYEGDSAFEVRNEIICPGCATEIVI